MKTVHTIRGPALWNLVISIQQAVEDGVISRELGNELCGAIQAERLLQEKDRG